MSLQISTELLSASILFFGSVNSHQRHASRSVEDSYEFINALKASTVIGATIYMGLLIYYFTKVAWYMPLALFALSALVGGIFFGLLDVLIGPRKMSAISWISWPIGAWWFYQVIAKI